MHEHHQPRHADHDSAYDDNVRETAAQAWARIKIDLAQGHGKAEDTDYWDGSNATKNFVALKQARDAGGPEGEFAEKVLWQIEKLRQSELHRWTRQAVLLSL